jgi:hypothetical protein
MVMEVDAGCRCHPDVIKAMGGKYTVAEGAFNPMRSPEFIPILNALEDNGITPCSHPP